MLTQLSRLARKQTIMLQQRYINIRKIIIIEEEEKNRKKKKKTDSGDDDEDYNWFWDRSSRPNSSYDSKNNENSNDYGDSRSDD